MEVQERQTGAAGDLLLLQQLDQAQHFGCHLASLC